MGLKYKFTEDTGDDVGIELRAIEYFKDIPVETQLGLMYPNGGGYLENGDSLSQEGECAVGNYSYVFDGAKVSGNAYVGEEVKLCGGARVSGSAYINGGYPMNIYDVSSTLVYTEEERGESEKALFNVDICGDFEISGYASIMHGARLRSEHDFYTEGPISGRSDAYKKRRNENYLTVYKTNNDSIAVVFHRRVFDLEDWIEYLNGLVKDECGCWKRLQLAFNNALVWLF